MSWLASVTSLVGAGAVLLAYRLWRTEQRARRLAAQFQQEIAERRRAETRYHFLIRNLPNTTVCMFDRHFRHIIADGELVTTTLPPGREMEGLTPEQVFPKDVADILLPFYKAVFQGQPNRTEQHFRTHTYRITFLPMFEAGSDSVELGTAVFLNVTEERATVSALRDRTHDLERSNRDLEQYADIASHELKSPLRRIGSFADLLQSEFGPVLTHEGQEYVQHIVDGVQSLRQVIDSLLTYSRVQPEQARARMGWVDLKAVIYEAVRDLAVLINERRARVSIAPPLPTITADPILLRQLMENLIANAIKFNTTGKRPLVRIEATRQLLYWEIRVIDNGPGIPANHQDKVFAMFQRFDSKVEGSGIGLALCKKIVGIHRGKIWCTSPPEGGSVFTFTLPAR